MGIPIMPKERPSSAPSSFAYPRGETAPRRYRGRTGMTAQITVGWPAETVRHSTSPLPLWQEREQGPARLCAENLHNVCTNR